jgi:hypothetical protein
MIHDSNESLKVKFEPFVAEIWAKNWFGVFKFEIGSNFELWRPPPRIL